MTHGSNIKTPVQIAPFVEVLGIDGTVEFLLEFGGAEWQFTRNPRATSKLSELVGVDNARQLGMKADHLPARIPLQKRWIAAVLHAKGLSNAEIARKMHVPDKTVRNYLKDEGYGAPPEERQLPLI